MTRRAHPSPWWKTRAVRAAVGLALLAVACGGGGATGAPRPPASSVRPETVNASTVPTLTILSPRSGDRVSSPVPIRYVVSGLDVRPDRGHLHLYLGDPGSSRLFELPLRSATGVVYLQGHPMLSGRREILTFQLATADHRLVQNPEARVTLHNVIIEGDKGA
jgi:hypothetical protein